MSWHIARMSAATLLIISCMLLPFLPGGYDGLAVTLSAMAQLFGVSGLLLVPLGIMWLANELRIRTKTARPIKDRGYWFAVASVCVSAIAALVASLGAFATVGPSLGIVVIALWAYSAARLAGKLKTLRSAEVRPFNAAPLYLIVVPIMAAVVRFALVGPACEFSRNRAIENSAGLIGDIERYHEAHGYYPRSLQSLWQDYKPGVIGVKQYLYEPNNDAYNLFFEHWSDQFGTREIVMYNKNDEHEMTSHDSDLLLRTPTELASRRGYYAVHDTSSRNWKRFFFD